MKRPVTRTWFALLWLALTGIACGHDIGDECKTSVDCDPNGTRSCDLSQPNGYCTVVGCDETSCPSSSACIRLFPVSLLPASAAPMVACDPAAAAASQCPTGQICSTSGFCAQCDATCEDVPCAAGSKNQCLASEVCLDAGVCAKQSLEQRECAKTCSSNHDCRSGYDCRPTGTMGSMLLTTDPLAKTAFCAPHVPTAP
jgi:hypothetical protein